MSKQYPEGSAIASVVQGYKQFKLKHFEESKFFDDLVQYGQAPKILAVACCDSRVDPAIVTDCAPGEIFVVRNVANLVPPFESDLRHHGTSAALEFGVLGLEVSDVILFGHSHCGGIRALMEAPQKTGSFSFINAWMDIASAAKQRILEQHPTSTLDEQAHFCERESLMISLNNLMTFPWIQERVAQKKLFLHAWYFDLSSGIIKAYQPDTGEFVPLVEE